MQRLKLILTIFALSTVSALGQTVIKGTVKDAKGGSIPGANIYIKDTFDGVNSQADGSFVFETEESGSHILVVSFIGFKDIEKPIELTGKPLVLDLILQEEINKLDGVTITAGAYEASDVKKITVLKPLDIVTTASAAGDIMGAINTLPGTATVGESGRLFVRGGEGYETKVFIDGLEVRNAFGATAPNVPTRGRFSPFLFKGVTFSTGGYSAEYGQALSSALVLNSNDIAEKTQGDISLMSVGGDLAYTKKWDKTSVSGKIQYTDLRPYQDLVRQFFDWEQAPVGKVGELVFRHKVSKNGLLKVYTNIDVSNFRIRFPNINRDGIKDTISVDNNYAYVNASYKDILNKKWSIRGGLSTTYNKEKVGFNNDKIDEVEKGAHGKVALNWDASDKITVNMGGEFFHKRFDRSFGLSDGPLDSFGFEDNMIGSFVEADYFASNKLVFRTGVRYEHSTLVNQNWVSPRLAMSYKVNDYGQFSLAYGKFLQSAQNDYAFVNRQLAPEQATHHIFNYQYIRENRVFRVETYWKKYDDLVKFQSPNDFNPLNYNNTGFGEAKGVDVFWRDGKTFKGTDYWVSYSFVDSERNYQDFNTLATPSFLSKHNFSFVLKHMVQPLRTQFGATYNYGSSRPFHNPNRPGFQNDRTPDYHDLSLNAAILLKQNIIIYMSSSNIFGRDNIFGYEYAAQPNIDGIYDRQPVRQGAKRFIFLGLFITLTKDGQENQLENL
ncbi:TonB-dependent receptor [Roseivirga sp. E12]|uniref:TonB-dependent receptor n=1 Tax=Roseivirga sp. E12 TaxID=2819237 RepID=UPI001ABC57DD|nr:TonB-dependent receptor [Roseivirga sp. E12]MBO3698833.1 TonB-dependent receptor [Roseivirga sp. E12]